MTAPFRALVVDDEKPIRDLTMRALRSQGFVCEGAENGDQAAGIVRGSSFDVVITDLRMPNRNGHSLAVELLGMAQRPAVVVLTGVLEPKLAEDLMYRGVDDVMFKPIDYKLFAYKVKGLVERRRKMGGLASEPKINASTTAVMGEDTTATKHEPISARELDEKLAHFGRMLPISDVAIEIVNMTNSLEYNVREVTALMQRDATLVAEVMKQANSVHCNGASRRINNLEGAIGRLGQKRVAELALAGRAFEALTANLLPWMDIRLCWRTSLAAGAAVRHLLPGSGLEEYEGLFLGAILHPLGRIVLATLYPVKYADLIAQCHGNQLVLEDLEREHFGETHTQVLSRLLKHWRLPEEVIEPLRHVGRSFESLGELYQPLRTKVELLKISILMGRLAAGPWEPWELVDLPAANLLERWTADELRAVVKVAETELKEHAEPDWKSVPASYVAANIATEPRELHYYDASGARFDFLEAILQGMEYRMLPLDTIDSDSECVVINACGAGRGDLAKCCSSPQDHRLILVSKDDLDVFRRCGATLPIPTSYESLRAAFRQVMTAATTEIIHCQV